MTKAKFKVGSIIRHDKGSTALMKITSISLDHGRVGAVRYYGKSFYGSSVGVYETDSSVATETEIYRFKTDDHIGRLRDYPELAE